MKKFFMFTIELVIAFAGIGKAYSYPKFLEDLMFCNLPKYPLSSCDSAVSGYLDEFKKFDMENLADSLKSLYSSGDSQTGSLDVMRCLHNYLTAIDSSYWRALLDRVILYIAKIKALQPLEANDLDILLLTLLDSYINSPSSGELYYDDFLFKKYRSMRTDTSSFFLNGSIISALRLEFEFLKIREEINKGTALTIEPDTLFKAENEYVFKQLFIIAATQPLWEKREAVASVPVKITVDRFDSRLGSSDVALLHIEDMKKSFMMSTPEDRLIIWGIFLYDYAFEYFKTKDSADLEGLKDALKDVTKLEIDKERGALNINRGITLLMNWYKAIVAVENGDFSHAHEALTKICQEPSLERILEEGNLFLFMTTPEDMLSYFQGWPGMLDCLKIIASSQTKEISEKGWVNVPNVNNRISKKDNKIIEGSGVLSRTSALVFLELKKSPDSKSGWKPSESATYRSTGRIIVSEFNSAKQTQDLKNQHEFSVSFAHLLEAGGVGENMSVPMAETILRGMEERDVEQKEHEWQKNGVFPMTICADRGEIEVDGTPLAYLSNITSVLERTPFIMFDGNKTFCKTFLVPKNLKEEWKFKTIHGTATFKFPDYTPVTLRCVITGNLSNPILCQ